MSDDGGWSTARSKAHAVRGGFAVPVREARLGRTRASHTDQDWSMLRKKTADDGKVAAALAPGGSITEPKEAEGLGEAQTKTAGDGKISPVSLPPPMSADLRPAPEGVAAAAETSSVASSQPNPSPSIEVASSGSLEDVPPFTDDDFVWHYYSPTMAKSDYAVSLRLIRQWVESALFKETGGIFHQSRPQRVFCAASVLNGSVRRPVAEPPNPPAAAPATASSALLMEVRPSTDGPHLELPLPLLLPPPPSLLPFLPAGLPPAFLPPPPLMSSQGVVAPPVVRPTVETMSAVPFLVPSEWIPHAARAPMPRPAHVNIVSAAEIESSLLKDIGQPSAAEAAEREHLNSTQEMLPTPPSVASSSLPVAPEAPSAHVRSDVKEEVSPKGARRKRVRKPVEEAEEVPTAAISHHAASVLAPVASADAPLSRDEAGGRVANVSSLPMKGSKPKEEAMSAPPESFPPLPVSTVSAPVQTKPDSEKLAKLSIGKTPPPSAATVSAAVPTLPAPQPKGEVSSFAKIQREQLVEKERARRLKEADDLRRREEEVAAEQRRRETEVDPSNPWKLAAPTSAFAVESGGSSTFESILEEQSTESRKASVTVVRESLPVGERAPRTSDAVPSVWASDRVENNVALPVAPSLGITPKSGTRLADIMREEERARKAAVAAPPSAAPLVESLSVSDEEEVLAVPSEREKGGRVPAPGSRKADLGVSGAPRKASEETAPAPRSVASEDALFWSSDGSSGRAAAVAPAGASRKTRGGAAAPVGFIAGSQFPELGSTLRSGAAATSRVADTRSYAEKARKGAPAVSPVALEVSSSSFPPMAPVAHAKVSIPPKAAEPKKAPLPAAPPAAVEAAAPPAEASKEKEGKASDASSLSSAGEVPPELLAWGRLELLRWLKEDTFAEAFLQCLQDVTAEADVLSLVRQNLGDDPVALKWGDEYLRQRSMALNGRRSRRVASTGAQREGASKKKGKK